jgi:hypothetical protein
MRHPAFSLVLSLAIIVPAVAVAQDACKVTDAVKDCFNSVVSASAAAQKAANVALTASKKTLQAKPTGVDIFGDPANSTTKDFFSTLSAAAQSLALGDKQQEVALTWNLLRFGGGVIQLQPVLHQPQLYSPLKQELTGADEAAKQEAKLNQFSDLSVTLSFSAENDLLGRHFRGKEVEFQQLFVSAVPTSEVERQQRDRRLAFIQSLMNEYGLTNPDPRFSDFPAASQADVMRSVEENAAAFAQQVATRKEALKDAKLDFFADLVANQPQLVLTGARRFKNPLAGPNETSAQASFEYSFYSLNGYRRRVRACQDSKCRLDEFKLYVTSAEPALRAGDRLKASVQETWIDAYSFALPADAVALHQASARRLTASLTYGRAVRFDQDGQQTGRFDLAAQYDNYTDDPLQKDRGTITFTYTQKITDQSSFPIGLVYANHGEFIGDVQRRFGVHFGITYKMGGPIGN